MSINTKKCIGPCGLEKTLDLFTKKENTCKNCTKEYKKKWYKERQNKIGHKQKKYQEENKEKIKEYQNNYYIENKKNISNQKHLYYEDNKDKKLKYAAQYRADNKDKVKKYKVDNKLSIKAYKKEYDKQYRLKNKEKIRSIKNKYNKERIKTDLIFKFRKLISKYIYNGLKRSGKNKDSGSIIKFLPYTFKELIRHIENLFEPWMTWENHGKYFSEIWDDNNSSTWTWQLDHIIPHSAFCYENMNCEEFRACWALSNLRPLSAKQNLLDGKRNKKK